MSHAADNLQHDDTQINWLELARLAASGEGHNDLGRGVQRLATLAAAVHRRTIAQTTLAIGTEKDTPWVQGRTPQAPPELTAPLELTAPPEVPESHESVVTEDAR